MATPVLIWEHDAEGCSRVVALENGGRLWSGRSCADGDFPLERGRLLDSFEQAQARAAFNALARAAPPMTPCPVATHRFKVRQESDIRVWTACGTSARHGDAAGLEEPFLSAVSALE